MSSLSIEQAKEAKARVESSGAYNGIGVSDTNPTEGTEVADPEQIDHQSRRDTRLADDHVDVETLPAPLVECGCGECPDYVDPLGDDPEGAFADIPDSDEQAADRCDDPQPMTVRRAATAYYAYQIAAYRDDEYSGGRLSRVEAQHAAALDAERDILEAWGKENTTTVLISLRISPVESTEGNGDSGVDNASGDNNGIGVSDDTATHHTDERRWVEPLRIDERLRDQWRPFYKKLNTILSDYDWEYLRVVGTTDSAATPHLHMLIWTQDTQDEITAEDFRSAIEKYVDKTPSVKQEHHPIEEGESDAVVVHHDPPVCDVVDDEQLLDVMDRRDAETVPLTTQGLHYVLNQRPDWALKRIENGESTIDEELIDLEGGAIAWASRNNWIASSGGIDLT